METGVMPDASAICFCQMFLPDVSAIYVCQMFLLKAFAVCLFVLLFSPKGFTS